MGKHLNEIMESSHYEKTLTVLQLMQEQIKVLSMAMCEILDRVNEMGEHTTKILSYFQREDGLFTEEEDLLKTKATLSDKTLPKTIPTKTLKK